MKGKECGPDSTEYRNGLSARIKRVISQVLVLSVCSIAACSHYTGSETVTRLTKPECSPALSNTQVAQMRGISNETVELLHKTRGMNNGDICTITQAQLDKSIHKANNPKPDHPGEAVAFRRLVQQDENGHVPVDGLNKAREHVKNLRAITALKNAALKRRANGDAIIGDQVPKTREGVAAAGVAAQLVPAGMASAYWTPIGPGNIGGRIRAIAIHPTNPSKMWVGSVSGGIWSTTDGGLSWQVVDDFMANLAISTLVIDPVDTNIMYVGTGEGMFNGDALRGEGIFKSIDGGVSWNQLAATATADFHWVNRLSISPNNPAILLAATRSGIWRSTDAGATWSQTTTQPALDVDFNPSDGSQAIASGSEGRAHYSSDGGLTWVDATGIPTINIGRGRVEVAYAPSNPNIVYSCVETNDGELWKSTDGGQSYGLINTGNNLGCNWYMNVLWIDPTDPQTLVTNSGIDLGRSHDGGVSFIKISEWGKAPVSAHADHHIMISHPDYDGVNNRIVYSGNDGGIYVAPDIYLAQATYTDDTGLDTGWRELNNNLAITQFYSGTGNASSGVITGGTQDNGTLRYTGESESWDKIFGGDGGFVAIDPTDPNYLYAEYIRLAIRRSTDGGATMKAIYNGIPDAGDSLTANFIAPYMLDPNNSNQMLAGGTSLWRTRDVKQYDPVWDQIKLPAASNQRISTIEVASGNSDIIWVAHNNGDVYKTINGTDSSPVWSKLDDNKHVLPSRFITDIAIDPTDHNRVYVSTGGFTANNLWGTTDGGASWKVITGTDPYSLPAVPIRSVVMHPQNAARIYVGTEAGVFGSEDGGDTWEASNAGPANVSVDQLFWNTDKELVAATHGRGMFKTAISGNDTPQIYDPLPGAILDGASVTFNWTDASASATEYWVYAGTSVGASDIFNSDFIATTQTSVTINNLPTDGSTVHLTMWANTALGWELNLYTYTASGGIAELTLPLTGSTLASRRQSFVWTDAGIAEYRLTIGSSAGATDYHDATYTGVTVANVADLPLSSTTLYVRLYTGVDYNDYTVIAGSPPELLSPIPGSVLSGPTEIFTWTHVGVPYYLAIGYSPGASEIAWVTNDWTAWHSQSDLPTDGRTVYVRIASYSPTEPDGWYNDYTYTASDSLGPTVLITAPAIFEVLSGPVTITATASDINGVEKVVFSTCDGFASTDFTGPTYNSDVWDTTNAAESCSVSATAHDTLGNVTTKSIPVIIDEPASCVESNIVRMVTSIGGGQGTAVNETLAVTFTGNITTPITGNETTIKICSGTTVDFNANVTAGVATCTVNSAATASSGTLQINDNLTCTNKPDGADTDTFRIRSGG